MKKIDKLFIMFLLLLFLSACNKKEYIYFNYNCNSRVDYHKCELKNNKINCNVIIPTCDEQEFLGWYEANEYEIPVDLTKKFTKNEILYARWENVEEPSSQVIEEPSSQIIEEPSSSEIEEPSSSEQPSSSSEQPSSSQTIVVTKYTIIFNANGGSSTPPSQSVKYNDTLPTINVKPTKTGYTFMGWYDSVSGGTQYYNSSNVAVKKYDKKADIILYARWKAKTYTITFNNNGGSGTPSAQTVTYNDTLPTISVKPTKTGYTFMGWYDSVSNGTQYYNSSNVAVKKYDKASNITLYAQWSLNVLKIRYRGNGGTWNSNNTDLTVDENGYVIYKSNKTKYVQKVYYGDKNVNLANYDNSNFISFKRKGYEVPTGAEWKIATKTFADNKKLKAADLASAGGCDLSKGDCTITLKVNWKKSGWSITKDYGTGKWVYHGYNSKELSKYYSTTMPFIEYVPSKAISSGDSLPLIIFLHGKGNIRYEIDSSGNLTEKCSSSYCILNSEFAKNIKNWKKTGLKNIPAIMMAPHLQYPGWGGTLSVNTIRAMVKYAKDKYNIDDKKVVLIGHSHGGYGVPSVFSTNKNLFSALVIMSGANPTPISSDVSDLKKIPLKGYTENNVLVMNDMKSYFNSLGRINDLTIYKTTHNEVIKKGLTEDKNNDKISDLIYWALSQTRK